MEKPRRSCPTPHNINCIDPRERTSKEAQTHSNATNPSLNLHHRRFNPCLMPKLTPPQVQLVPRAGRVANPCNHRAVAGSSSRRPLCARPPCPQWHTRRSRPKSGARNLPRPRKDRPLPRPPKTVSGVLARLPGLPASAGPSRPAAAQAQVDHLVSKELTGGGQFSFYCRGRENICLWCCVGEVNSPLPMTYRTF